MSEFLFKSLFDISKEINQDLNLMFNEKLDRDILIKLKKTKTLINNNDYVKNSGFRNLVKRINNLFFIKDFFDIQKINIDVVTLLTFHANKNNEYVIGEEKKLAQFKWFNDWFNFTKLDLSKHNISSLLVKYVRKQLNTGHFVRKYRDTDYLKFIDDIFDFINSFELEEYPLIKSIVIFKQILNLNKMLTIDVINTLLMIVLKKYCLDVNGMSNFFISFLIKNMDEGIEKNIEKINAMNFYEFANLFKEAYLESLDFSFFISCSISNLTKEINSIDDKKIDPLYGKELKELLTSKILIYFPDLYLYTIYLTRPMFYKKIDQLSEMGLVTIFKTSSSVDYLNKKVYEIIIEIEREKKERMSSFSK